MIDENTVIIVVPVEVTIKHILSFMEVLNDREIERPEEEFLTLDEILKNHKLMKYLATEAVNDGVAMFDPFEFWNNDGWCDFRDYR